MTAIWRCHAAAWALPLILLAAGGTWAGCKRAGAPQAGEKATQRWHCPMHPDYTSDRPGTCPVCSMDLVPIERPAGPTGPGGAVYNKDGAGPGGPSGFAPISIDAQRQQLIGLKSAVVRRAPFADTIRTVGRVTYDETRVHHIHTKYEAYVERLYANFTGKFVRKGEPLASLYSPDLYAAEQEYLLVLRGRKTAADADRAGVDLVETARQKLLLWDISEADLQALEQSGKPSHTINVYSPISGYVTDRTAYHGMRLKPEDSLFDIVNLSRVWVLADVYEYELPRVRVGQKATMMLSYWPGRTWQGRVTYIFPSVDPKTRTLKVRLEFDNSDEDLKAEMFADVVIQVQPRTALLVPEDAVLETGDRRLVFVHLGQGRLQPREIKTGDRANRLVEVKEGLAEGEEVATGANFLVDSESRLQAAISTMARAPASAPAADGGASPDGGARTHAGHTP